MAKTIELQQKMLASYLSTQSANQLPQIQTPQPPQSSFPMPNVSTSISAHQPPSVLSSIPSLPPPPTSSMLPAALLPMPNTISTTPQGSRHMSPLTSDPNSASKNEILVLLSMNPPPYADILVKVNIKKKNLVELLL